MTDPTVDRLARVLYEARAMDPRYPGWANETERIRDKWRRVAEGALAKGVTLPAPEKLTPLEAAEDALAIWDQTRNPDDGSWRTVLCYQRGAHERERAAERKAAA